MNEGQQADIVRMRGHAQRYLADASSLQRVLVAKSDGAYLLQLVAFEILLKAALRAHGCAPSHSHNYVQLFDVLPADVQRRVCDAARTRFGCKVDLANLLRTWSSNFVKLRYAYEVYDGQSPEDVARRGTEWVAAGAKTEEADFRYYPMELQALTEALMNELDLLLSS